MPGKVNLLVYVLSDLSKKGHHGQIHAWPLSWPSVMFWPGGELAWNTPSPTPEGRYDPPPYAKKAFQSKVLEFLGLEKVPKIAFRTHCPYGVIEGVPRAELVANCRESPGSQSKALGTLYHPILTAKASYATTPKTHPALKNIGPFGGQKNGSSQNVSKMHHMKW